MQCILGNLDMLLQNNIKKKRVRNVINKVKLIDDIASNTIHIKLHTYKITKSAWRTAIYILSLKEFWEMET